MYAGADTTIVFVVHAPYPRVLDKISSEIRPKLWVILSVDYGKALP